MTNTSRQVAVGAAVAAVLILGANSLERADALSTAAVRLEMRSPSCGVALQAQRPGCTAMVLQHGYDRAARIVVKLRNEALDAALDAAGELIARFKQF